MSFRSIAAIATTVAFVACAPAHAAAVSDPACPTLRDGFETLPEGVLTGGDGEEIVYLTSGGYTVRIDEHQIIVTDPLGTNKVENWGDPHENLNGKHIKDWEAARRTLLLADGSKITMHANGPQDVVQYTAIYDGRINVQILNSGNLVFSSNQSLAEAVCRDRAEYDGETSTFSTNAATGVATYRQLYLESDEYEVTPNTQPLGETGGFANPTQVNDYYDDPRLGHT